MRASEKLILHKDEIIQELHRYGLTNPRVFGSVARGEDDEQSDIDLLVDEQYETDPFKIYGLYAILEDIAGVKVDVVFSHLLDRQKHAIIFNDAVPL